MDSIQTLQESYARITLIPVVGSGISVPFGLPDWRTLIERAAEHFLISATGLTKIAGHLDRYEFIEAADTILGEGVSELDLQQYVLDSMYKAKAAAAKVENNYDDLAMLSRVRYITTNYDQYLNDLAGTNTFLLEQLEKISINQFQLSPYDHAVIPLHGVISRPESIVLSGSSYKKLYDSPRFHEEFQQLRTHYTFLFIGFSFEDEHVQTLFEKVLQRFEAQHFILFEKRVGVENKDKIERLKEKYGLEAVYYDASADGHTKAIGKWLRNILNLRDRDVDLTGMDKLPKKEDLEYEPGEDRIAKKGRELIKQEKLTELYELYSPLYTTENFIRRSAKLQIEIVCGLLWYWGYQRRDDACEALMEQTQKNPVLSEHTQKLVFLYGQFLWNSRQFDKGISVLRTYDGDEKKLVGLLLDLLEVYRRFLPAREDESGSIPVYGLKPRTEEDQTAYRAAYGELKEKYVNPETYNLREITTYNDRYSEQIAYYWLGVAAGQLFHEHADAVQYLLRAYELAPNLTTCEELAQNYFAQGLAGVRYREDAKKYQLDMDALLKAKIRFQYVMSFSDETAVQSMYERSGLAFLRTLFILKDFIAFYEHWNRGAKYIPETDELLLLKAEADAESEHAVSEELLDKLDAKSRRYVEYCCAMYRAGFFTDHDPSKAAQIRAEILKRADAEKPLDDRRIIESYWTRRFLPEILAIMSE